MIEMDAKIGSSCSLYPMQDDGPSSKLDRASVALRSGNQGIRESKSQGVGEIRAAAADTVADTAPATAPDTTTQAKLYGRGPRVPCSTAQYLRDCAYCGR